MSKNTICLWYDKDAEAAARFYAATFPDSAVSAVHHAPSDYPGGKEGDVPFLRDVDSRTGTQLIANPSYPRSALSRHFAM